MRNAENLTQLARLGPDFVGLIFYEKSPRFIGAEFSDISLKSSIKRVGVFVNEKPEIVIEKAAKYKLDFVQLHGNESPEFCAKIKAAGLGVFKAVSVGTEIDFEAFKAYEDKVDYFLFDTQGKGYGGHGITFDWKILEDYNLETPFFIAGGISNENIVELLAVKNDKFVGIDVNSKYEISPGLKDIGLLKDLFEKVFNDDILSD